MRPSVLLRVATIGAGLAVVVAATAESLASHLAALALLAAAAILCELLEGDRARAREPVDEPELARVRDCLERLGIAAPAAA